MTDTAVRNAVTREQAVLQLRAEGKTWGFIAAALGVSRQRAHQIGRDAKAVGAEQRKRERQIRQRFYHIMARIRLGKLVASRVAEAAGVSHGTLSAHVNTPSEPSRLTLPFMQRVVEAVAAKRRAGEGAQLSRHKRPGRPRKALSAAAPSPNTSP